MGFRRKRRSFYIASPTYGIQTTASTASLVGAGNSNQLLIELVPNGGDAPESVAWAYGAQRRGNMEPDTIVDSISGSLHWGISCPSGGAVPSGIAGVAVRALVFSAPSETVQGNTALSQFQIGGANLASVLADVSSASSAWLNYSNLPAGVRVYWSKVWYKVVYFGTAINGGQPVFNSTECDPPSTWVSCRPRKRFRASDRLNVGIQYSITNLNGYTGATQITMAPSFKIAAHNVRHRKV